MSKAKLCIVFLCVVQLNFVFGSIIQNPVNSSNSLRPSYRTHTRYGYGYRSGTESIGCSRYLLKNGRTKYRRRQTFVRFICNTGYQLMGDKYGTCVRGKWDMDSDPVCVRPSCKNMNKTEHNNLLIYPTINGAVLNFYCKQGYTLNGKNQVYCDGTFWHNTIPLCLPTNTNAPLKCDFEAEDICGWQHDLNHDFDWRRMNYNTPSGTIGTGPSHDHTKGKGKGGYYMYIESSSRKENDTARLISPFYQNTKTDTCFEFYYHMYGATTGTLKVYLKKINESWNLQESQVIFEKKGNQGDHWFRSLTFLGPIEQDYQIIIEGIRGRSYISDIAIDDVKIIEDCKKEEEILSTSTTEVSYGTEKYIVESCENRCGMVSTNNEHDILSCDCNDNCLDDNRCCPDYIDHCLMESTIEESTTTDMSNDLNIVTTEIVPVFTRKTTVVLPKLVTKKLNHSYSNVKTTLTTMRTTTTMKKNVPRKPIFIVDEPTPLVYEHTPRPTVKTITTVKITPSTTKMTTKTTPTTTKSTKTTKKTTVATKKTTKPTTTVKKIIKPIIPKAKKPTQLKETDYNSVPERTKDIFDKYDYIEEMETKTKGTFNHFSEKKVLPIEKQLKQINYMLIIGSAVITSFILVILVTVGKKFGWYNCGDRRKLGNTANSQSDVRFLTSDEILDFSCVGYDDL